MEKEFVEMDDLGDLPEYREPLVRPDTSKLANGTEDYMLEVLDNKDLLKEIADGDLKFCREVRFLAILLQMSPEELETFLWMKEMPVCRVKEVLAKMGFRSLTQHPEFGYGLRALMTNLFDKEVRTNGNKKNLLRKKGKYYIITLNRRKESKMKKIKNGSNGVFQGMDMLEMKEVAKGVSFEVRKGASKKELAEKLFEHIKAIPEDKAISKEALMWFNSLDRLKVGDAKTWEEAKAQEAEAMVASAKELGGEEVKAIPEDKAIKEAKAAEVKKAAEKEAAAKAEEKKKAGAKPAKIEGEWQSGSSAQICFEAMKAAGKKGLTKKEAEKELEGKFETTNLASRISTVFGDAVTNRGIAKKNGDKFIAVV